MNEASGMPGKKTEKVTKMNKSNRKDKQNQGYPASTESSSPHKPNHFMTLIDHVCACIFGDWPQPVPLGKRVRDHTGHVRIQDISKLE